MFGHTSVAFDPAKRGYWVAYHPGETNRCPGCGHSHWYVGRLSAECGLCGTALPILDTGMRGVGMIRQGPGRVEAWAEAA